MNDFTKGNIAKQIIFFSIPMLIGSFFQQLYSIVDAVVVGRFLGSATLAAVGISMTAFNLLIALLFGLTTGASVVISQFFGSKQEENLSRTVSTSIVAMGSLAIILTLLGVIFTPQLLNLLNAPDYILSYAIPYMRIVMLGTIFLIFFNMYMAYMRALGNSKVPLYILIFSTIFNALINVFFVVILGRGIFAVAVGTIISQGLATLICILYCYKRVPLLRVQKLTFDRVLLGAVLRNGLPAALQMTFVSLAALVITRLINSFGTAAIAGIVAAQKIDAMAIMPVSTLSLALSTFVAQNIGARQEERAKQGFRKGMLYMVGLAMLISIFLIFTAPRLVAIFIDTNDLRAVDMIYTGQAYLRIMVIFYFLFAFLFAFNAFYRGVGDAIIAMVFPIISLTIRTFSAYALVYLGGMGPEALAWSIPIGWGISSILSFVYYKKRRWAGKMVLVAAK